jgi:hypothetical protein
LTKRAKKKHIAIQNPKNLPEKTSRKNPAISPAHRPAFLYGFSKTFIKTIKIKAKLMTVPKTKKWTRKLVWSRVKTKKIMAKGIRDLSI